MTMQKKSVLGRGLDALIPQLPVKEVSIKPGEIGKDTGKDGIIASIDVVSIQPNPFQPRVEFDEKSLEELKQSIVEKGVIQPITVRRKGDGYELISGERRMRAAQKAGLKKIPAYILHIDDEADLLELALIENIQREQLNPIEVAVAFKSLVEKCNLTQEDIAQKVGKDRATVSNFLRLLKLPQVIQVGLRRGEISMGQARALLSLRSESEQIRLFKRVVKSDITVRKLEQIVKIMTGEMLPKRKKPQNGLKYTARLESVEERLRTLFGTKVAVRARSDGRGEIVIDFYSTTDLDRLIDLIMSIDQH